MYSTSSTFYGKLLRTQISKVQKARLVEEEVAQSSPTLQKKTDDLPVFFALL